MIVTGDIDLVATLTLLAKHYGPLEAKEIVRSMRIPEPRQEAPRIALLEQQITLPQLVVGFHTPPPVAPM